MIKVTVEMLEAVNELIDDVVSNNHGDSHTTIKRIIELHEASKPTPPTQEPSIDHELLCDVCGTVVGNDVNHFSSSTNPHIHICSQCVEKYQYDRFFIDKDTIEQANPKPLTPEEVSKILFECRKGTTMFWDFARDIEKAHGIGVHSNPSP